MGDSTRTPSTPSPFGALALMDKLVQLTADELARIEAAVDSILLLEDPADCPVCGLGIAREGVPTHAVCGGRRYSGAYWRWEDAWRRLDKALSEAGVSPERPEIAKAIDDIEGVAIDRLAERESESRRGTVEALGRLMRRRLGEVRS